MNKTFSFKGKEKGFFMVFLFLTFAWTILILLPFVEGELDVATALFMLFSFPTFLGVVLAIFIPSQFPKIVFSPDKLFYKRESILYRDIYRIDLITKDVQGRAAGMGYQDVFLMLEGTGKTLTINLTSYRMDIEEILNILIQCSPNARVSAATQEFLDLGLDYFVREKLEKPVKKNPFAWILLGVTAIPFALLLIGGVIKIFFTIFSKLM